MAAMINRKGSEFMCILVAGDDRLLNITIYYNLSATGYEIDGAMSKTTAVRFCEKQEYRLQKVLTKDPQIVLTRQVFLEKLWDMDGSFVEEHALTSTISRGRGKIVLGNTQYSKTVYSMGHMWIGGIPK